MEEQIIKVIWSVVSIFTGVVAYYLKKRDSKIESNENSIKTIEKDYLTKAEFEKMGIDEIRKNYVSREELEKTEEELEEMIKENNCQVIEKLDMLNEKVSNMNKDNIDKEEFLLFFVFKNMVKKL